jgi:hypothetical protein
MMKNSGQKNERSRALLLVSTLAFLMFNMQPLSAQDDPGKIARPDKLFSSEETLNVTITGPWRDVRGNKANQEPYAGKIEFRDNQGKPVSLDLTVQRRGVARQRVCKFPPIRLRFNKEEIKGTIFRGQDSLKMVTHCKREKEFEQYFILEMLAYRMYNLITEFSFRVRPLNVTYVDSETGRKDVDRFAFLIEDDSDVAKRLDLKKVNIEKIQVWQLEPRVTSEFTLFQYMIANVDWAALDGTKRDACCHNSKLIGPEPLRLEDKIYPIPYDFDSSGLVDPPYASTPAGLPMKSVTQRLYRGYCEFNNDLEAARELFLKQETAIYSLINNEDRLYGKTKKKSTKYIGEFFEIIKDPKDFDKNIIKKCRKLGRV